METTVVNNKCFNMEGVRSKTVIAAILLVIINSTNGLTLTQIKKSPSSPYVHLIDRCPYLTNRTDCSSVGGTTASSCFTAGCLYCPTDDVTVPSCVYPPQGSQSDCSNSGIDDGSKVDCMPDNSTYTSEGLCYYRDCEWCQSSSPDVPWCYYNSTAWQSTPPVVTDMNYRVDCTPDDDSTEQMCLQRGCIYEPVDQDRVPWCYFPVNYGYSMQSIVESTLGWDIVLIRNPHPSLFGSEVESLYLSIEFHTESRLRLKFYNSSDRYEVPVTVTSPSERPDVTLYNVTFTQQPVFSIQVVRKDTGTVIFDTSLGGLTFSDQFLQFSTLLPSTNVYGFGEDEQYSFKHIFQWNTWAFWARDQSPSHADNIYGVHPHYTVIEADGNTHGVLIMNSNAQEVQFTPAPGLIYRTIGGIIDIYIFLGPTPENTVQQYTEAIGRSPLPPYWSLGFQLSRWGYNTLDNMQAAINRTAFYGIPQDVQYGDIDIMQDYLDFTINEFQFAGLSNYIDQLREEGVRFVAIVDPGIATGYTGYTPYDLGEEMNVWIKRSDGSTAVGQVWPNNPVHYPDFTHPNATDYWTQNIQTYLQVANVSGLWIDMNEPSNFVAGDYYVPCEDNNINNPPYMPHILDRSLYEKTICADFVQYGGVHYDIHSLYGWSESIATQSALQTATGKRAFVLTRSSFVSSGKYTNHWLGDNFSTWANLRHSIIGILQFNQFGIPLVGADICGFNGESNAELCQRWMEAGAFYPFSRNHNTEGEPDQDPGVWGADVALSSRNALLIRYTLLPYINTLFYQHTTEGNTVARALWHEFPLDTRTYIIDEQFLLGPAFMVSPVLYEGMTNVTVYFPTARWYSYYDGQEVTSVGRYHILQTPMEFIQLHVRGGYILPTQEPAVNTKLSRQNPVGLIVALDSNNESTGSLYYDDGESLETIEDGNYFYATFNYSQGSLSYDVINDGYSGMTSLSVGTVRVLGASDTTIAKVIVNGKQHSKFTVNNETKEVTIHSINVPANKHFTITLQ